jgi:hypothetical protein
MLGNVNLNSLMSMFSGLGAGGGLGVQEVSNGEYLFLSLVFLGYLVRMLEEEMMCHSVTVCSLWTLLISSIF